MYDIHIFIQYEVAFKIANKRTATALTKIDLVHTECIKYEDVEINDNPFRPLSINVISCVCVCVYGKYFCLIAFISVFMALGHWAARLLFFFGHIEIRMRK